jgi:phosphoribosylanthranilate isomerase
MTKVKICGITNLEDALLSAKFGADALGFNFYEKSSRYIAPEKAREICAALPPTVLKVGVFVNESADKIIEIAEFVSLDAVQLHGDESAEFVRQIKERFAGEIIKALRVSDEFKPEDVLQYEADAILLDAFSKQEYGGTGETFDWKIAKAVREIIPKMYLAGGLNHNNVANAFFEVKPFAIDVCSGVESKKGKKDYASLILFISKLKNTITESKSFYNLLRAIQEHPQMYFGKKSLWDLFNFLLGFKYALDFSESNFETGKFFEYFEHWSLQKLIGKKESPYRWIGVILEKCNGDEEKAFDLFFALLEEFKLEKENLSDK